MTKFQQEDYSLNKLAKPNGNYYSEGYAFRTKQIVSGILKIASINLREGVKWELKQKSQ